MKKKISPFIIVLPAVVACVKDPVPTKNPPPLEPTGEDVQAVNEYPMQRDQWPDGKCYVEFMSNPPYQEEVSCEEPVPYKDGNCLIASKKDPARKILISCK